MNVRKASSANKSEAHIVSTALPAEYTEAYKFLRTNILVKAEKTGLKKLIVTSSVPKEGKTTVAVNTAISLAGAGNKVVVVDCDLRRPSVHKLLHFNSKSMWGLADILNGIANTEDCITYFDEIKLHAVMAGDASPNLAELLGTKRMDEFINELGESFDFIIMDTPPVSEMPDAAVISKNSDGVLFVVRQNYTKIEEAQKAKNNLEHAGANIVGCVVSNFKGKGSKKLYYYYKYKK